jgi:hypothetical protein
MAMVTEALNAPKVFKYDAAGNVISMNGREVVRSPDGRILGVQ